ncbi:MAG: type II CAAX endopeptidase family protein [Moraxella sp.]|nr:type II CAAX endopeptidase family protein [Moraxella sp.]
MTSLDIRSRFGFGKFTLLSSIGLTVIAMLVAFLVLNTLGIYWFAQLWYDGDFSTLLANGSVDGRVLGLSVIFVGVIATALVWGISYRKFGDGRRAKQFLGWHGFSRTVLVQGVVALIIFNVVSEILSRVLNQNPMTFMDDIMTNASSLSVVLMMMGAVIAAPIYEEVVFRGLIFGMFADALHKWRWGVWLASVISGLLFAGIHLQYNWYGMTLIFVLALIFAYVRVAGSLTLAIILHMLNNAVAMGLYFLGQ